MCAYVVTYIGMYLNYVNSVMYTNEYGNLYGLHGLVIQMHIHFV